MIIRPPTTYIYIDFYLAGIGGCCSRAQAQLYIYIGAPNVQKISSLVHKRRPKGQALSLLFRNRTESWGCKVGLFKGKN